MSALGVTRRAVLTHSPTLHAAQSRGFDETLAKARKRLTELQSRLARGKTAGPRRRGSRHRRDTQATLGERNRHRHLGRRGPSTFRLTWRTNQTARKRLEDRIFGKRILFTNRDTWSVGDVVAAYGSESEVEAGFRQQKDPHVVSFGPMHHCTTRKSASTSSTASWP